MPKSLKKAAERAISFEDDKIQRLEYQIRCLEKENERHQRENMINLRVRKFVKRVMVFRQTLIKTSYFNQITIFLFF